MEDPKTEQQVQHNADRRARELYRYYQPGIQAGMIPSWLRASDEFPLSSPSGDVNTPPISESSAPSESSRVRPSTAIGSEALILGTSNSTLTSFAQLAALRLNVERVFIAVLDRDRQHIIAEATRTLNLNDASVHDDKDHIWLGTSDTRRTWSVCKVSSALSASRHKRSHCRTRSFSFLDFDAWNDRTLLHCHPTIARPQTIHF